MKLVREGVARSAASIAARASALDHEIRDHPVERQPVVVILLLLLAGHFIGEFLRAFRESDEIGYCFGRFLFQQANDNVSLRRLEYGIRSGGSAHAFSSRPSYTRRCEPRHQGTFDARTATPKRASHLHMGMSAEDYQPFCLRSSVTCAV